MSGESFEICTAWVRPRFSQLLKVASPFLQQRPRSYSSHAFLLSAVAVSSGFLAGCGSAMSTQNPPPPPGPTTVTVFLSSTANDKLVLFGATIASIALLDKKGNSIILYNNLNASGFGNTGPGEFMHLDGAAEPLVTVPVPKGIYPSATVTVGYCSFTNVWVSLTGGVHEDTYAQGLCSQGTGTTTVNLPSPITISGTAMALVLILQVPQSYTLIGTGATPPATYTISPVFTLSAIPISSQPTNELNGKIAGLEAQITSINLSTSSLVIQTPDGIPMNINSSSGTAYQGIASFSSLTPGMLVNMDLAIQPDASLLATRVEVDDPAAPMVSIGPQLIPGSQSGEFITLPLEHLGCTVTGHPACGVVFQSDANTVFSVSIQFSNVQSLPFTASFSAATMFLGQNVSVFSSGIPNAQSIEPSSTITLMSQTINATVMTVSSDAGFSVYTVAIAPYDLIPTLQATAGTTITRLNNPTTVIVYVDTSAELLNSSPLSTGSVLRFRGLIFDDNGTLRMDCDRVSDGVPE